MTARKRLKLCLLCSMSTPTLSLSVEAAAMPQPAEWLTLNATSVPMAASTEPFWSVKVDTSANDLNELECASPRRHSLSANLLESHSEDRLKPNSDR
jgi:uncharacterized membrane protein